MNETTINNGVKSAAAGLTAILVAVATALHMGSASEITTISGLLVTGVTSLVSAYFLGKHVLAGSTPTQGTLKL